MSAEKLTPEEPTSPEAATPSEQPSVPTTDSDDTGQAPESSQAPESDSVTAEAAAQSGDSADPVTDDPTATQSGDSADPAAGDQAASSAPKRPPVDKKQVSALLNKLTETYPSAFKPIGERGMIQPLKLGVHKELLPIVTEWGFDRLILRYALGFYTRQRRYQIALLKAEQRVDLQGEPGGEISDGHRQIAQSKLDQIEQRRKQNAPQPSAESTDRKPRPDRKRPAAKSRKKPAQQNNDRPRRPPRRQETPPETTDSQPEAIEDKLAALQAKFNTRR